MVTGHFSAQILQCPWQGMGCSALDHGGRALLRDGAGQRAWRHVPASTTHICLIWHCSPASCWHRIRKGRWGRWGRGRKGRGDYAQLFQKGERGREVRRNEAERGPGGQAGAGSPQLWWWALPLIALCSRWTSWVRVRRHRRCGFSRNSGTGPGLGKVSGMLYHSPLWPNYYLTNGEPSQTSKLAAMLSVFLPTRWNLLSPISSILFCFFFPSSQRLTFSKLLRSSQWSREKAGKNKPSHLTEALGSVSNIPEVTWLSQWKNNLGKCWRFHLSTICPAKIGSGPESRPCAWRPSWWVVSGLTRGELYDYVTQCEIFHKRKFFVLHVLDTLRQEPHWFSRSSPSGLSLSGSLTNVQYLKGIHSGNFHGFEKSYTSITSVSEEVLSYC